MKKNNFYKIRYCTFLMMFISFVSASAVTLPTGGILVNQPDLKVEVSSQGTTYTAFNEVETMYKISNTGDQNSTGLITLTVNIRAEKGSFTYTLPAGWSLQSKTDMSYIFVSNNIIAVNTSDTITINYISNGGMNKSNQASFSAKLNNGSGGESNFDNNMGSVTLDRIKN
ncbi:hypothetical protein [Frigoriflavimonas asaccharolytica]|uniref:Uncharacterized protein n=1 Tax=Frigoriflavimonas asaccharolytica TaxID=2735899 RepID=A0A8J8GCZ1_9FLAO|nr:hypothetical protein [Frigoriflavimonas asaccharolytica]NRS93959.1 hypothetical protein [Frigoriflavimonas asaccharolytica]